MDRRWAPAGAAVAVVGLVSAVALLLGGDDEPGRVTSLAAPSASASPAPEDPAPTTAPRDPASSPGRTSPGGDPDTPVSSDDEPTPEAPEPAPAPRRTAAPSPEPAPSRTRTAAPSPVPSAAERSAFAFDAAYGTDEPYEVVVQYGDSSSCPHQRVTHTVRETAERIVVTLEAQAMDPGRACTADYRQMLVPVRLQRPLGDRVLVDGSRGEQVAVDRSCNRPFDNPPPPRDCTP